MRDYYCTRIPDALVEVVLAQDRLEITYTDEHCVQWRETVCQTTDVTPEEWAALVDEEGINPDGIEMMLDGLTREDLLEPLTG